MGNVLQHSHDGKIGKQNPLVHAGNAEQGPLAVPRHTIADNSTSLPLKPPFRFVQLGFDRTGSTFQFTLLLKIAHMKSPPGTDIIPLFTSRQVPPTIRYPNSSFVIKSHFVNEKKNWTRLVEHHNVTVFATAMRRDNLTKVSGLAVHLQMKEDLAECSACEIDKYIPFFDLTNDEVEHTKRYMKLWERLRLCCGYTQMSRYNRARLLGCDMSDHVRLKANPHCENYDLEAIEQEFTEMGFRTIPWGWREPGDCALFEMIIKNQAGRPDRPSCESLLYPPTHNFQDQKNENVPSPNRP